MKFIFFIFTLFLQPFYALFSSCCFFGVFFFFFFFFVKFANYMAENVTNQRIRPLRSIAVVMTWRQSNVSTTNEDVCLALNDNVTWSIDVHRCMNRVGLKQVHLRKSYCNVNIYVYRDSSCIAYHKAYLPFTFLKHWFIWTYWCK